MEEITEENVEKYIRLTIAKYAEKHMLADMFFWRLAMHLLSKKYGFNWKLNENIVYNDGAN